MILFGTVSLALLLLYNSPLLGLPLHIPFVECFTRGQVAGLLCQQPTLNIWTKSALFGLLGLNRPPSLLEQFLSPLP